MIAKHSRARSLALCLFASVLSPAAWAAAWSSTNIQYMYGWNWDPSLGREAKGNITLEHVSGFGYGDNFFFVDIANPASDTAYYGSLYGQWNPRLSLSKVSGAPLAFGPVGDVLLTGELGYGAAAFNGAFQREYNYGIGFDIKVPGIPVLAINFWIHDTPYREGVTYQISPYWGAPFSVGTVGFVFEGFLDFIGPEGKAGKGIGKSEASLITQPRFLLDAGSIWKKPGNLYLGTEVAIWWNEFGIEGKDEFVPQAMVKWVF